jgi:hypothetical protein
MDIFSHGLWGAAAFGRKNGSFTKKKFWTAFAFGVTPDMFSFGVLFAASLSGFSDMPVFHSGPPNPADIPPYVYSLYNATHSLFVFIAFFCILWAVFKKPVWESLAWGLHILVDIPTHSYAFFPTPFLWPFFDFKFNGWSWGSPWIFFPNILALTLVYFWFYRTKRKKR